MKVRLVRKPDEKKGKNNTHFVIKHAYVSGTIYIDNEVADKNPEVKDFSIDLPFDEPEIPE